MVAASLYDVRRVRQGMDRERGGTRTGHADAEGKVLVVDDEPGIVGLLVAALEDEGYRVATAGDGVTALAVALADPPALVLLDVRMPGELDGPETCRRLRADSRTREVPVVFVTATPPEEIVARLGGNQNAGIIVKPFTLTEVLDTVGRHFSP